MPLGHRDSMQGTFARVDHCQPLSGPGSARQLQGVWGSGRRSASVLWSSTLSASTVNPTGCTTWWAGMSSYSTTRPPRTRPQWPRQYVVQAREWFDSVWNTISREVQPW